MGTDPTEHGFVNIGIFEQLHYSELAIVDVTGLRPNCFIELGYALGCGIPVIVTAKEGTVLPFDQSAIPCHFWDLSNDPKTDIQQLLEFMEKNIGRPPLVSA
jgi:nucleoside 2-deoxyribosyltransferase